MHYSKNSSTVLTCGTHLAVKPIWIDSSRSPLSFLGVDVLPLRATSSHALAPWRAVPSGNRQKKKEF